MRIADLYDCWRWVGCFRGNLRRLPSLFTRGHFRYRRRVEKLSDDGDHVPVLSSGDVVSSGASYIAVEYVNNVPTDVLAVDDRGAFVGLGGFTPEEVKALATVASGSLILSDGRYGELYAANGAGTAVTALNEQARSLVGKGSVKVSQLRTLKQKQEAETASKLPKSLPKGSLGSMAATSQGTKGSPVPGIALGTVGAAMAAVAAYLFGCRRQRKTG